MGDSVNADEPTDPRGTMPPPAPRTAAQEFAELVSNLLDDKLRPIAETQLEHGEKLDCLTRTMSRTVDEVQSHGQQLTEHSKRLVTLENQKRVEKREGSVAWFALLLSLACFGALGSTLYLVSNIVR